MWPGASPALPSAAAGAYAGYGCPGVGGPGEERVGPSWQESLRPNPGPMTTHCTFRKSKKRKTSELLFLRGGNLKDTIPDLQRVFRAFPLRRSCSKASGLQYKRVARIPASLTRPFCQIGPFGGLVAFPWLVTIWGGYFPGRDLSLRCQNYAQMCMHTSTNVHTH